MRKGTVEDKRYDLFLQASLEDGNGHLYSVLLQVLGVFLSITATVFCNTGHIGVI